MKEQGRNKFTPEQRAKIVEEYEKSDASLRELCMKYGINSKSSILNWRSSLQKSSGFVTFAPSEQSEPSDLQPMKEKTREELEAELSKLRKELEWTKLQNLALNTMIDIAEEQGIKIRKKSGARQ